MSKDYAGTRDAFASRLGTLTAYRFLLVTFELFVRSV